MKWRPGDIAILLEGDSALLAHHGCTPLPIGMEVELIKYWGDTTSGENPNVIITDAWEITYPGAPLHAGASECCLKRLPPPDELASWDDCVWQPDAVVTVSLGLNEN